ncbi:enoyl-CoA hydratase/isomerase family protein [Brevibacillus sp. Leaf182]|uniref:enoyl-CoA hydratase/isomerase family protein n=1 Tax=Brevibacillus sp. Leaf182 TaxID=1736290 RepID=UPI0006FD20A4|nr:enoyl-CoA hydratase-related protein [Brevibacillus sp. Leaf182]RAT94650.1 enoyl-CoA hydratase [Brevibacillus sp. Leaf182]
MSFVRWLTTGEADHIALVELNRPEMRNAFNTRMAEELMDAFEAIKRSDSRVVLVRSTNPKAFCSGADLKERNGMTETEWLAQHELFEKMFYTIADMPQPVIAVVEGYALAGGFELVLNCDFVVAAETAVFGLPEVTRGIMPGCGGTRLLAKRIGVHHAKEWVCTGRKVNAQEADHAGLLNRLTSSEALWNTALELAEQIAQNAPLSVQYSKAAVEALFGLEEEAARKKELVFYHQCVNTEDRLEGVQAFVEKREPRFLGK